MKLIGLKMGSEPTWLHHAMNINSASIRYGNHCGSNDVLVWTAARYSLVLLVLIDFPNESSDRGKV